MLTCNICDTTGRWSQLTHCHLCSVGKLCANCYESLTTITDGVRLFQIPITCPVCYGEFWHIYRAAVIEAALVRRTGIRVMTPLLAKWRADWRDTEECARWRASGLYTSTPIHVNAGFD